MARKDAEQSAVMGDEGERVKSRRERLGMTKVQLGELSGVDRTTIWAIEEGQGFRMDSLAKIHRALDQAEADEGLHSDIPAGAGDSLVTFNIQMPDGGATVTVQGPVADADKIAESVRRMLAEPDDTEDD